MSMWRLVSGIISIVLSAIVLFQSMFAGLGNALSENGEVGGSAGLIVAICLLTGGIVSIVTRNGGTVASFSMTAIFGLAAVCGFTLAGSYGDLNIWAFWCLICMIMAIVSMFRKKPEE